MHAEWIDGAGCPTGAKQVKYNSDPPYNLLPPSSFTDTACPTGDAKDNDNEGLLFVKTGETLNNAAATAEIDLAGQEQTAYGNRVRHSVGLALWRRGATI